MRDLETIITILVHLLNIIYFYTFLGPSQLKYRSLRSVLSLWRRCNGLFIYSCGTQLNTRSPRISLKNVYDSLVHYLQVSVKFLWCSIYAVNNYFTFRLTFRLFINGDALIYRSILMRLLICLSDIHFSLLNDLLYQNVRVS